MSKKKYDQENFPTLCRKLGLPEPLAEHKFHAERRWRFDWIFPGRIALEINGGIFIRGRHATGSGLVKDYEKLNTAQAMGWIVIQVTPAQIGNSRFADFVKAALEYRKQKTLASRECEEVTIPGSVLSERFGVDVVEIPFE